MLYFKTCNGTFGSCVRKVTLNNFVWMKCKLVMKKPILQNIRKNKTRETIFKWEIWPNQLFKNRKMKKLEQLIIKKIDTHPTLVQA